MLRARGFGMDSPQLVARTAWTTDELSEAVTAADPRGPFDIVTLMIGVNDQYRGRGVASFGAEYASVLRRAIAFAASNPKRVLAISIPDWSATPFAEGRDRSRIRAQIDEFNARASELAAAARVRWADVTPVTREMASNPALVIGDGLHPSGEMYRRWAEILLPPAEQILRTAAPFSR